MKIVYTPIATLVPSLTPEQDAEILAAAGDDSVLVVAKTPDRQREEIVAAEQHVGVDDLLALASTISSR